MSSQTQGPAIEVAKDGACERKIPTAWRASIRAIVEAFVNGDYWVTVGAPGVEEPSRETAEQVREFIADYGARLISLPEEAWNTSTCLWYGSYWDALVDLWTEEEGASDLVLGLRVAESGAGFKFSVRMVYVP